MRGRRSIRESAIRCGVAQRRPGGRNLRRQTDRVDLDLEIFPAGTGLLSDLRTMSGGPAGSGGESGKELRKIRKHLKVRSWMYRQRPGRSGGCDIALVAGVDAGSSIVRGERKARVKPQDMVAALMEHIEKF